MDKRFERVPAADAKASAAHTEEGKAFFHQGKVAEAINSLTKALALDSTNKEAHEWLTKTAQQAGSILVTTVAGRLIRVVTDGPAIMKPETDRVSVSTSANKISIERERVLLDGIEIAKLPSVATKVTVTLAAGQIAVTADGVPMNTKQLTK